MFVLGNLLVALAQVLNIALTLYLWIVIIRALISWVNPDPYNPIVQFLHRITDPVLFPIARALPPMGGLDISPLILIMVIYFTQWFVVKTLMQFGLMLNASPM
ncbi:MAG: YggT family protein [Nitrospinae bacterium]|nr:YggT family protein [Nitrospinota bacterium]